MADDVLPTPRALLTSLITTLSSIPPAAPPPAQQASSSNPLKFLPPSQARPLLTTLHTLYPNFLLPALDLLDRRLVTRIIPVHNNNVTTATTTTTTTTTSTAHQAADASIVNAEVEEEEGKSDFGFYYLVRSAQQPSRRGRRAAEAFNVGAAAAATATATGPTYVVQTRAWNCSCAAFAFSAFPAESTAPVYRISSSSSSSFASVLSHRRAAAAAAAAGGRHENDEDEEEKNLKREEVWEFGGLSRDGLDAKAVEEEGGGGGGGVAGTGGGVPCCKHLLACVLAERWRDVLGAYVEERRAGREEVAGLVAGI